MNRIDPFIADLYRSVETADTGAFRATALRALAELIEFDGALWGAGNYTSRVFHSVTTLGLLEGYPSVLENSQHLNPILPRLLDNLGRAVDMRDVIADDAFYASDIYRDCFAHYGIERVLSFLDRDRHSHIHSLVSLYRFDRGRPFTLAERKLFDRAAFHMLAAAGHAFFVHVVSHENDETAAAAICDAQGLLHEAQPAFIALLECNRARSRPVRLPFTLPQPGETLAYHGLCINVEPLGDLFCVRLRRAQPTDELDSRDRAIVQGVCRGMTFKDIARELDLAPSTVSNRLYRLYRELGVANRSSLVRLIHADQQKIVG